MSEDELVGFKAWPEHTDVVWIDVTPDLIVRGGGSDIRLISGSWLSSLEKVEEKH